MPLIGAGHNILRRMERDRGDDPMAAHALFLVQQENQMKRIALTAALIAVTLSGAALAGEITVGDLRIDQPYARATVPGAPVAGGYMTITNTGSQPDRLVGGSAPFAGKVEIHEMKMQGDVMRMREVAGGLEIPGKGSVTLKPGGYHVMFMKLKEQLKEGEKRTATLVFEKAGKVDLPFAVKSMGRSMKHRGRGMKDK